MLVENVTTTACWPLKISVSSCIVKVSEILTIGMHAGNEADEVAADGGHIKRGFGEECFEYRCVDGTVCSKRTMFLIGLDMLTPFVVSSASTSRDGT